MLTRDECAPSVLIVSGPIASGKSTIVEALATEFRAARSAVAVMELDRVYMMLDDTPLMSDPGISRLARRAAAALVDQYVVDGVDLIIVEGDFWTAGQREQSIYRFPPRFTSGVRHSARERRGGVASRRVGSQPALVAHSRGVASKPCR